MAAISNIAQGLRGLLRYQTDGRGPGEASDVIAPTIDITQLLAANLVETLSDNVAVAAIGATAFPSLVVPQNQLWYVRHLFVSCTPGAGASIEFAPCVNYTGVIGPVGDYITAANPQSARAWASDVPLFLPPGSGIQVFCKAITAGPITANASIVLARLGI